MAQDIFSKLNPLDDEFWSEEPEEKLQKMTYMGYAGAGLAFFSLFLVLINYEGEKGLLFSSLIFDTFLIPTCPEIYEYASSDFCYEFGNWVSFWPFFGTLYFPVVTSIFLVNVFAKKSVNQIDKILGGLLIFMLSKDFVIILLEFDYWMEILTLDIWFFLAFISELGTMIILMSAISLVFSSKLYSDKIFIYSLISIFTLSTLIFIVILSEWFQNEFYNPLDEPLYLLYVISLPISLGLFFYSLACLYSYRYNIEPWSEEENPYGYGQLPPEAPAEAGISVANASKLKEAKELLDQGIIDDEEFQKIKDEYFPK